MGKQRRWTCAHPEHPGILAPARLRRVDIRRYCFPCSEAAGVLVERTCPSLEQERHAKEERRKAKARRDTERRRKRQEASKRETQRRRAAKVRAVTETVGDLYAELERVWPIVREVSPREDLPKLPPDMNVTRHSRKSFVSGHAWYAEHRIHVGVPQAADHAEGCGTLIHELAHLAAVDREKCHHPEFWAVLVVIAQEAYGAEVHLSDVMEEPTNYLRQQAVEQAIRAARERKGL